MFYDKAYNVSFHQKFERIQKGGASFPQRNLPYTSRNIEVVPLLDTRHSFSKNSFVSVKHNRKEQSRSRT